MPSAAAFSGYLWGAWLVYWQLAARNTKPTEYQEPPHRRMIHYAGMVAAFVLLYGLHEQRLFAPSLAGDSAGLGLELVGIAFSVWARIRLGRNWSGLVTLKSDHELITDGPYRLARHPIYSGLLLAFLGSWLTVATLSGLLGFAVLCASILWKSAAEEALMRRAFPDLYPAYAARVARLVPGLF